MAGAVPARRHSRLSPSMMGRVEQCTASHFLTPLDAARESSEAAAYGTCCHHVAEKLLKDPDLLDIELLDDEVSADGFTFIVDQDMLEMIDPYVTYCQNLQEEYGTTVVEAHLKLGKAYKNDPRQELNEIGGTVDFGAFEFTHDIPYVVVDLKTGRGLVGPEAFQPALYGLMWMAHLKEHWDGLHDKKLKTPLKTVIIQPKGEGDTVKEKIWTWEEVRETADRASDLIDRIRRRDFFYKFGDHCTYCPALAFCPEVRAIAQDAALAKVTPSPEMLLRGELTVEHLEEALAMVPLLDKWGKAVVGLAEKYLREGGQLEGAKLTRKRSNRRWLPDKDPIPLLEKHGVDPYEKKLKSPNQAEQALPKAARPKLKDYWEKPQGDFTITVGESSKDSVTPTHEVMMRGIENAKAKALLMRVERDKETQS